MNFAVHRQLSVAIENQPGRLAAISRLLAENGHNIRNLSVIDNVEQGMIRFIPSEPERCRALLEENGLQVVEADVLVLILQDIPGRLARLSQALADAQINIDYAYGSEDTDQNRLRLVMKVSSTAKAEEVIQRLLNQSQ